MRWVNMLDAWLDTIDFTSLFQVSVLVLVLLKLYTLQVSEQLDHIVDRVPSKYGWFRRAATIGEAVAWLWLVLYQYEAHLSPRPPGVFLAVASLASVVTRLIIIQQDYWQAYRLGHEVAPLKDALNVMKVGYADDGKAIPPLKMK